MSELRISALYRYPVKSCRGHAVESLGLDRYGAVGDRRWMVVDAAERRFLSQREHPRMVLIRAIETDGVLRLGASGHGGCVVERASLSWRARNAWVWGTRVLARDAGDAAAQWLSALLGVEARLVGVGPEFERAVDVRYDPRGAQVGFADGFPLLLISQASLDELNRRLDAPVEMIRFRPNLVVEGCAAHAEDGWKRLRVGDTVLHVVKPCSRCAIPGIDPDTGQTGSPPGLLRTLAGYRRIDGKVYFGQNLVHVPEVGGLRVGDAVEVLE